MKLIRIRAKRAFQPTKIPGADYVLNPYAGCHHGCVYCYAKFMGRFYSDRLGGIKEWGEWVVIKENFPGLVERESPAIASAGKSVYMSSISDIYQPLEGKERLTRRTLEAMDKSVDLSILTKSSMVVRDIDIFHQFRQIEIGMTLNGWDERQRREIEGNASPVKARMKALEKLHGEGLPVYGFVSPIVPGIEYEWIVEELGFVREWWFEFLNPRPGKPLMEWLKEKGLWPSDYAEWVKEESARIRALAERTGIDVRGIVMHERRMEVS